MPINILAVHRATQRCGGGDSDPRRRIRKNYNYFIGLNVSANVYLIDSGNDKSKYVLVGSTVKFYRSWLKDSGRLTAVFEDSMLLWKNS